MKPYIDYKFSIVAYPSKSGGYMYRGATYGKRGVLKSRGCIWDPKMKFWSGPREAGEAAGAIFMVEVMLDAFCHEKSRVGWVTEHEVELGETEHTDFCGWCDSRYGRPIKILEVLGGAL
jgi:hypothetical protein